MTVREAISEVVTGVREHNADSVLFNKYVYGVLLRKAILLLKRDADQKRNLFMSSVMWDTVKVEMEEVNILEDTCICIPLECMRYRSKKPLPEIIEAGYGFLFQDIATPDDSIGFRYTTPASYRTKAKLEFNKTKYAFIDSNNYLYTPNASYPCLKIMGLFNALEKDTCSRLDNQFPCTGYLYDFVVTQTIQELSFGKQIPNDNINNKDTSNLTLNA